MTHALFANLVRDTSGGWNDLVSRGTLAQCLTDGDRLQADWAQVVDLATGEVIFSKSRKFNGPPLQSVEWAPGTVSVDSPISFSMLVSLQEAAKLALLGGEHWVRARLAKTESPVNLPTVRNALEFLSLIETREFPFLIVGEHAGWVEQLRAKGMVEAEFTMETATKGDWAVILEITALGRAELSAFKSQTHTRTSE